MGKGVEFSSLSGSYSYPPYISCRQDSPFWANSMYMVLWDCPYESPLTSVLATTLCVKQTESV